MFVFKFLPSINISLDCIFIASCFYPTLYCNWQQKEKYILLVCIFYPPFFRLKGKFLCLKAVVLTQLKISHPEGSTQKIWKKKPNKNKTLAIWTE